MQVGAARAEGSGTGAASEGSGGSGWDDGRKPQAGCRVKGAWGLEQCGQCGHRGEGEGSAEEWGDAWGSGLCGAFGFYGRWEGKTQTSSDTETLGCCYTHKGSLNKKPQLEFVEVAGSGKD